MFCIIGRPGTELTLKICQKVTHLENQNGVLHLWIITKLIVMEFFFLNIIKVDGDLLFEIMKANLLQLVQGLKST